MAAGHALYSYGLKLWYISSEAKDKCDTVIYAVNRTDQGMFSPPSASGTAELLYVARSSPTATSKQPKGGQPKEQHLREGSEETGRAVPKDAGIWALSWGRYSQDKVISFTLSPAFADFRRLCVKFSIFCHLKLKCTAWVLRPYYGKLFGLCCWQLEISICSFFLFPFQMCIIQTQRGCTNVPKRWEERTFRTTMKLLACLVNTEAAEADLGRHFPYPYPADTYLGADGYLKSMSKLPSHLGCHLEYSDIRT